MRIFLRPFVVLVEGTAYRAEFFRGNAKLLSSPLKTLGYGLSGVLVKLLMVTCVA